MFSFLISSSSELEAPFFRSSLLANLFSPLTITYLVITVVFWAAIIFDERYAPKLSAAVFGFDLLYVFYLNLTFPTFHLVFLGAYIALMFYQGLALRIWARLGMYAGVITLAIIATTGWPFFKFETGNIALTSQLIAALWVLICAGYFGWKVIQQHESMIDTLDRITVELLDTTLSTEIANEELKQRNKEITTLLQINEIISSSLEWEALFTNTILALKNSFIFKNFSLFLYDEDAKVLRLRIANGVFYDEEGSFKIEPGKGIAGWVFQNRTPVCVGDVSRDHRFVEFSSSKTIPASLLCVPLVYRGAAIGVISLDSATTDNFTRKDQKFLESIAYLISVAITNSKHYRIVKEESVTDNLTGLTNYRALQNKFREALEQNRPETGKLSFMMIDIDYFKKINDTYGHQAGNRVLRGLSDLFRSYFRKDDVVARYGGEEFAIILKGSPIAAARDMAENLRHRVAREKFYIDDEHTQAINLTISIGLSGFDNENIQELAGKSDDDHTDLTQIQIQLIRNADEALYEAKRVGRNIVITWEQAVGLRGGEGEESVEVTPR